MPDFVRVRDKSTGHEGSISVARAVQLGPEKVELLDEPAAKASGLRRPKAAERADVLAADAAQAPAAKPTRPTAPKESAK